LQQCVVSGPRLSCAERALPCAETAKCPATCCRAALSPAVPAATPTTNTPQSAAVTRALCGIIACSNIIGSCWFLVECNHAYLWFLIAAFWAVPNGWRNTSTPSSKKHEQCITNPPKHRGAQTYMAERVHDEGNVFRGGVLRLGSAHDRRKSPVQYQPCYVLADVTQTTRYHLVHGSWIAVSMH